MPGTPLRSRLAAIDRHIADLEAQLARLRVEKEGVLESLDALVYPILTLPPEITSEIFLHCDYVDGTRDPHRGPLRISYWPDYDHTCITAFFDAPRLREARLSKLSFARVALPWIQLIKLELVDICLAECLDVLKHTPNLESLTFSVSFSSRRTLLTTPPHTLPHLLTLELLSNETLKRLDHLNPPALARLDVWLVSEGSARFESLVARSRCAVRTLLLHQTTFQDVCDFISALPDLTELTLRNERWSSTDFTNFFEYLGERGGILPALEVLNIDWCRGRIRVEVLTLMLSERRAGVEGTTKLKSFRLSFDNDHEAKVIQETLGKLLDLRLQGLKMEINSLPKWGTTNINSRMMDDLDTYEKARSAPVS
ncbi:hypothetical protein FB451DRAFT_1494276 [Mycena latifolia]|nr:hypothetical protein FB451DRAFT_1494276 [Mycena latifolia]